jgi:transmembrane sensor
VRLSEQQFRDLLDRYLKNTASKADRDLLDMFFASYQADVSDSNLLEMDRELKKEILEKINLRILSSGTPKRARLKLWLSLAACILLFIVAFFFIDKSVWSSESDAIIPKLTEEKTIRGQKLIIKLSDSTKVFLNGSSTISFPEIFNEKIREVTVTGEAYFEVVKDGRPFVVHANETKTEVLGTSFNIQNIPGKSVQVTLAEGKVKIHCKSGRTSILKPNQQAIVSVSGDEITTRDVNILRYISWKDNVLYFDQTTLKEATETLEAWFATDIEIQNPALENCMITGRYREESLENVLSSFQFLLKLKIGRQGGLITINGKGCK